VTTSEQIIEDAVNTEYKHGFVTDIESESAPPGLNEDIIRLISQKKDEPEFMLAWRLKAYQHWLTMKEPAWPKVHHLPIAYQNIIYYSAPKQKGAAPKSLDEVDPKLLEAYSKLGISLREQERLAGVAVDAVFDSVSVATTGQFERTLIIAEAGASVSYLEGCTAPMRDENQLHAAVVELIALDDAQIKYSTVQNWYPGDELGRGGIYNFVTKRGLCKGRNAKISWTQVETGSAITWKYPSCVLLGDNSSGEFYSIAVTNHYQQADTGTKMVHLGKNTRSTIISKGISAGHGQNSYRGLVQVRKSATHARNFSQCDSLLIGNRCGAHTFPYIEVKNSSSRVEHEASTSKIGDDQIFYCNQRGISTQDAVNMIVNGFCKDVFQKLPMEFAVEAQKLLGVSLEGSVG